jgi:hypothetical protein
MTYFMLLSLVLFVCSEFVSLLSSKEIKQDGKTEGNTQDL